MLLENLAFHACLQMLFLSKLATSEMDGHIIGGEHADITKWPFIAFVVAFGEGKASTCGGSLISSQTVLTAAHCLDDFTNSKRDFVNYNYTVLMGHAMFSKATMLRKVVDYQTHQKYSPESSLFDVGVMFLAKPVEFSNTVKKAILMKELDNKLIHMEVAGWGLWSSDTEKPAGNSPFLKSLKQLQIPLSICRNYLEGFDDAQGIICAGKFHDVEYAYSGDSGGPLVKDGTFIQVGLVSFRVEKAGLTVYTSVPHYYQWIEDTQISLFDMHCPEKKINLKIYSNFPGYN